MEMSEDSDRDFDQLRSNIQSTYDVRLGQAHREDESARRPPCSLSISTGVQVNEKEETEEMREPGLLTIDRIRYRIARRKGVS